MSAPPWPKKRPGPSGEPDHSTKSFKQVKFSRPSTDMDVQHRQKPLVAQHSLEQLNADPTLLAETFKPALTIQQQAGDLRHIMMYNHVTRKNIETSYLLWRKHRGLTWEEQFAAIDCPLYEPYPTYKISNPGKAVQIAITFHRLFQLAKAAGHTNLAIHSAKKLLDYHVFCLLAVSELEHRENIPQQTAWFNEAIEYLTPPTETFSTEPLPQSPSTQVRPLHNVPASVAGPPANTSPLSVVQDPNDATLSTQVRLLHNVPASVAGLPANSSPLSVVQDPNDATSTTDRDLQYHKIIESMIRKDFTHVSAWGDIAVDAELKEAMTDRILVPLTLPPAATTIGMAAGVLLHGVPGCGKTYLCRALAKAAGLTFFNVECSSLISKWQGDSVKLIQLLFKRALECQPSIIFINEVEALMKRQDSSDAFSVENIKRGILVQMSNIEAERQQVTIIGASNRPYILDEAFVRRFSIRLHVPPPDTTLKMRLLKVVLDGVNQNLSDDDLAYLANNPVLEGASVAHMTDVIRTLSRHRMGLLSRAKYFDKRTQRSGVNVIVPYQHEPTLPLPDGVVHCSWEDFSLEERCLLRLNPIKLEELYYAFRENPPPVGAAALELHMEWSKQFGTRCAH